MGCELDRHSKRELQEQQSQEVRLSPEAENRKGGGQINSRLVPACSCLAITLGSAVTMYHPPSEVFP